MANDVYVGKRRNGWLVFLLGLVTLTVWWFIWMFQVNRELERRGMARAAPLLHTILFVVPLVNIVSLWRTAAALRTLQAQVGSTRDAKPTLLALLPYVLPIIGDAIYILQVQNGLNEVWEVTGKTAKPGPMDLRCPSCEALFVIQKRPHMAEVVACPTCGYEGEV